MKYFYLIVILALLVITVSCANVPLRGDAGKDYTFSATGICNAPNCTITHTIIIEIKADVKKDQKAEATQKTTLDLKATGL